MRMDFASLSVDQLNNKLRTEMIGDEELLQVFKGKLFRIFVSTVY